MVLQKTRLILILSCIAVLLALGIGYAYKLHRDHQARLQYLSRHTPPCVPAEFVADFYTGALRMDSCNNN